MAFLIVKIKEEKDSKGIAYKNELNLADFRQVALLLTDLESFGGNVEKAMVEFKKNKETFPW